MGEVNSEDSGKIYYEPRGISLGERIGKVRDAATGDQFSHIVNGKLQITSTP